jgi:hypothetical protein
MEGRQMTEGNGARPAFTADLETQQVIQPTPRPVNWLVNLAKIPDPIKGLTKTLVVVDAYGEYGMHRYFLEPGAAIALAEHIAAAGKMGKAGGVVVVEGGQAERVNREARRQR